MMNHNILVGIDLAPDLQEKIRSAAGQNRVTCRLCRTADDYAAFADQDIEILLSRYGLPDPRTLPHLKWIQTCGAGVDHLISHPLARSGVSFTTASGIHAACMSEVVFAFILHFQRSLAKIQLYQRLRKWPAPGELFDFFERPELEGQSLMVVGLGAVGRRIARIGKAFGMRMQGIKRNPESTPDLRFLKEESEVDEVHGVDALKDIVSEADYLVLCLPLTPETRGLIGREILDRMKASAVLINVGRGGLVDEVALAESLRRGGIAGAALDVFAAEPLPPDHPFYQMENVIVSPHIAGATRRSDILVVDIFVENLGRYLAGQPLLNRVDWSAGY